MGRLIDFLMKKLPLDFVHDATPGAAPSAAPGAAPSGPRRVRSAAPRPDARPVPTRPRAASPVGRGSYGITRLGLSPSHVRPEASGPACPARTRPARRGRNATFRLPACLLWRLRALARVTHRFQYTIVVEALRHHLAGSVDALAPERREEFDRTEQALARAAECAPPGPRQALRA